MDNTGLQAVLPKLLSGVLAALIGALKNDTAAEGNDCLADEQLKQLKSLVIIGQQADGGSFGVFVGYLADVLVADYDHWREGSHQVERPADLVAGCLGVSKLLSFPHGANVAVQDSPLECDIGVVSLA